MIDLDALVREVRDLTGRDSAMSTQFLARGEYSLNYLIECENEQLVVRLVTGSQIGLSLPDQVRYEAHALTLLETSGRTPRLKAVQPQPNAVPYPFLIEAYLPGRPLDYAMDLEAAARCVAAIHQVPVSSGHGLQVHADPGLSIVNESRQWAEPYLSWEGASRESRDALRQAFSMVAADLTRMTEVFAEPDLVIVNYDLNTHNFIVRPDDGFVALVDWEKARIAPAVQDLAHFLLPTTLWREATSTHLTTKQADRFVDTYLTARPHLDQDRFLVQLTLMQRLIALRAVSWCSWAVQAAATGERVIANTETLERSRMYLEPVFLEDLFAAT